VHGDNWQGGSEQLYLKVANEKTVMGGDEPIADVLFLSVSQ
jgi:hypothetical protein